MKAFYRLTFLLFAGFALSVNPAGLGAASEVDDLHKEAYLAVLEADAARDAAQWSLALEKYQVARSKYDSIKRMDDSYERETVDYRIEYCVNEIALLAPRVQSARDPAVESAGSKAQPGQLEALRTELARRTKALEAANERVNTLQAALKDKPRGDSADGRKIRELEAALRDLSRQRDAANSKAERLGQAGLEVKARLENMEQQNIELAREFDKKNKQLESLAVQGGDYKQALENARTQARDLEEMIARTSRSNSSLKIQFQELTRALDQEVRARKEMEKILADRDYKVAQLSGQVTASEQEAQRALEKLQDRVQMMNTVSTRDAQIIQQLQEQVQADKALEREYEAQVDELKLQLATAQGDRSKDTYSLKRMERKVAELENEKQNYAVAVQELDQRIRELKKNASEDSKGIARYKSRINQFEKQAATDEQLIQQLEGRLQAVEETSGITVKERRHLEARLAQAEKEKSGYLRAITDLETNLRKMGRKRDEAESRAGDLEKAGLKIKDRLENMEQQNIELARQVETLARSKSAMDQDFAEQMNDLSKRTGQEVMALERELAQASQELKAAAANRQQQEKALEQRNQEVEALKNQLDTSSQEIAQQLAQEQLKFVSVAKELDAQIKRRVGMEAQLDKAEEVAGASEKKVQALEKALAARDADVASLKESAARIKEESGRSRQEIAQQLAQEQLKFVSVTKKLDEQIKRRVDMEAQLDKAEEVAGASEKKVQALEKALAARDADVASLKESAARIKEESGRSRQEIAQQLAQEQLKFVSVTKELDEQIKRRVDMEAQLDKAEEVAGASEKKVQALEKALAARDADVASLKESAARIKEELGRTSGSTEDLKKQLAEKDAAIAALRESEQSLRNDVQARDKSLGQAAGELADYRDKHLVDEQKFLGMTRELDSLIKEREQLAANYEARVQEQEVSLRRDFQAQVEAIKKTEAEMRKRLQRQQQAHQSILAEQDAKVLALSKRAGAQTKFIEQLKGELARKSAGSKESSGRVLALEQELKKKATDIESLQSAMAKAYKSLDEADLVKQTVAADLAERDSRITALKASLQALRKDSATWKQEKTKLVSAVKNLEESLEQAHSDSKGSSGAMAELRENIAASRKKVTAEVAARNALQKQFDKLGEQHSALQDKLNKLEKEKQVAAEKNQALASSHQELTSGMEKEIMQLAQEVKAKNEENEKLSAQLKGLAEDLKKGKGQSEQFKEAQKRWDAERGTLAKMVFSLQEQAEVSGAQTQEIQKLLASSEKEAQALKAELKQQKGQLSGEKASLQDALKARDSEIRELTDARKQLQAARDQQDKQLQDVTAKHAKETKIFQENLTQALQKTSELELTLQKQTKDVREKLESKEARIAAVIKEREAVDKALAELKKRDTARGPALAEAKTTIETLKQQAAKLRETLTGKDKNLANLISERDLQIAELSAENKALAEVKQKFDALQQDLTATRQTMQEKDQEIAKLVKEVFSHEKSYDELVKKQDDEMAPLREAVKKLTEKAGKAETLAQQQAARAQNLAGQLAKRDTQGNRLSEELQTLTADKTRLTLEVSRLKETEAAAKQLEKELAAQGAELTSLRQAKTRLEKKAQQTEDTLSETAAQAKDLTARLAEKEKKESGLARDLKSALADKEDLATKLAQLKAVQGTARQLQQQLIAQGKEVLAMQQSAKAAEQRAVRAESLLGQETVKSEALLEKLEERKANASSMAKDLEGLSRQNEQLAAQVKRLKNAEGAIRQLEKELASQVDDNRSLKQQLASLGEDKEKLAAIMGKFQGQVKRMEAREGAAMQELTAAHEKALGKLRANLEGELGTRRDRIRELSQELIRRDDEVTKLRADKKSLDETLDRLKQESVAALSGKQSAVAALKDKDVKIEKLKQAVGQAQAEKLELNKAVELLRKEIGAARMTDTRTQAELKAQDMQVSELQKQVDDLAVAAAEWKNKGQELAKRHIKLEQKHAEAITEKDQLAQELARQVAKMRKAGSDKEKAVNKAVGDLQAHNKGLLSANQRLGDMNKTLIRDKEALLGELERAGEKLNRLDEQVLKLNNAQKNTGQREKEWQAKQQDAANELAALKKQLQKNQAATQEALEKTASKHKQELAMRERAYSEQLRDRDIQIAELNAAKGKTSTTLEVMDRENQGLIKETALLKEQLEEVRGFSDQHQKTSRELVWSLDTLRKDLKRLSDENQGLKSEMGQVRKEAAKIQSSYGDKAGLLKKLTAEKEAQAKKLASLQQQVTAFEQKAGSAIKDREALTGENSRLRKDYEKLVRADKEQKAQLQALSEVRKKLEADLRDKVKGLSKSVEAQLAEKDKEYKAILGSQEKEITALQANIKQHRVQQKSWAGQRSDLENQVHGLEKQITQLTTQASGALEGKEELKAIVNDYQKQTASLAKVNEELRGYNQALQDREKSLQEQIRRFEASQKKLQQAVSSKEGEYKNRMAAILSERDMELSELVAAKAALQKAEEKSMTMNQQLQEQVQAMQKKLKEQTGTLAEAKTLKGALQKLQGQNKQLEKEQLRQSKAFAGLQQNLKKSEASKAALEKELKAKTEQIAKLETGDPKGRAAIEKQLKKAAKEKEELYKRLQQTDAEIAKLNEEKQSMNEQLESSDKKLEEADKKIEALGKQQQALMARLKRLLSAGAEE